MNKKYYFIEQRIIGVLLLAISAVIVTISVDITAAFITVPLGLWLLLSKEIVIYTDESFDEEENEEEP